MPSLSATPAAGPRPRPMRRRRVAWLSLGLLLLTALGTAAGVAWKQHRELAEVRAGLPVRPDLTGRPALLGELLERADSLTQSWASALEGVAELGRLYHANGFHHEASVCWQILRTAQPAEARWCYYLADLSRIGSDHDATNTLLHETLRLAPHYAPARLHLANLQFKSGEREKAARNYRLHLEAVPTDPHARLGLARLAVQEGHTAEARRQLEVLLKDAPHFASGHNLYSEILAADGDAAGAERHRWLGQETLRYRDAGDPWLEELQAWCHDYERLCMLGTLELQTENRAKAQALFERAIALQPDNATAYELLGDLHLKRNEPAKARPLLEQAFAREAGQKTPMLFNLLSQAHRQLGQAAEAARIARAGLAQIGEQPELFDALGLALAASGEHEEAITAWQAALSRQPNDAGINYNLATSLLALGRLDDALAALDRSLTLQPMFLPTLLLRGEIELEAAHLDRAEKYLRPAFTSHPENPRARQLLAKWHRRMGAAAEAKNDPTSAERHYRDGLTLDANHGELQVSLGLFYLVQARPTEAIDPLASYHRSNPESPQGCVFLGQAFAASGKRDEAREILSKGVMLGERAGNARIAEHCRRLLQQL
jgi:predicted Zn-dependent protease